MFEIAEKLGFIKARAVRRYAKAESESITERKNTCFFADFRENRFRKEKTGLFKKIFVKLLDLKVERYVL